MQKDVKITNYKYLFSNNYNNILKHTVTIHVSYSFAVNPIYKPTLMPHEDENSPVWIQDSELGGGRIRYIGKEEKTFWKDIIEKYLKPLENNEAQQKKTQENLIELRNKMSLMFFMLNALFIVIIFTLQYTNAVKEGHGLSIPLPCYAENGRQLTLEPISLLFMVVYGLALVIQFISMFFHRMGTFLHIIASTDVNCMKPNQNEISAMDIASKIALVKEMQQIDDDDDTRSVTTTASDLDEDSSITQDDSPKFKRRKTIIKLTKRKKHQSSEHGSNLGSKFMKNFMDLADDLRKERISETSDRSRRPGRKGSSGKRRSKKAMRAMESLQNDKHIVLHKADAIETKWNRMTRRGDSSQSKVENWIHLVRDVLSQSRTSLNTIGEEEKRSSFPWRHRISRANSVETMHSSNSDDIKTRSLPKRASYAGTSALNIIADEDESENRVDNIKIIEPGKEKDIFKDYDNVFFEKRQKEGGAIELRPKTHLTVGPRPTSDITPYLIPDSDVSIDSRPKSYVSPRISEEDTEAHSIDSESEDSDVSTSATHSVTFKNEAEFIELKEAASGSTSVPAPIDTITTS